VLFIASSAPAGSLQVDATATVAAWNLKAFTPRDLGDAELLAQGIADLDAEVVGLVEVNPDTLIPIQRSSAEQSAR